MPFHRDDDDVDDDVDDDLRMEAAEERRRNRWHWCETCHGHTGPGSPCYDGDEEDDLSENGEARNDL